MTTDVQILESAVVRFAGDSGDGMQLTGSQFTNSTALSGSDLATFPDFPAEIRAPVGTTFGVSAFQINFGAKSIKTIGDEPDVLVAMNPAALKVSLDNLRRGGLLVVDAGSFTKRNLQKAGYETNPLEDGCLEDYQLITLDASKQTVESVKEFGLGNKDALRSKNMYMLGLMLWMFDRSRAPVTDWLEKKFAKKPEIAAANIAALNAGHAYGETAELSTSIKRYHIGAVKQEPGLYKTVTGSEALSWGLAAGGELSGLDIVLGSYPITPASPVLHTLSSLKDLGILTFQAEDEIAAVCAALGAAFGGALGVTSSSGPGIALKGEALGLAISTELPLVVVNVQRGGPSTGLPTKTEQSDLYQAIYGRNGDAPLPVLATRSPADCFETAIEACRIALKYMTPVILLSDGFIANAAEPWKLPDMEALEPFEVAFASAPEDGEFNPYQRDDLSLARNWAKPGTPGCMHRIGGIEKSYDTGHISYDPANHQKMTDVRAAKVAGIAREIPPLEPSTGSAGARIGVVGWGSTFGPIEEAVKIARSEGVDVSHVHFRHLNPMPSNTDALLKSFDHVLIPEMNTGQLKTVIRDRFFIDAQPLNKVSGQPFKITEVLNAIRDLASEKA
ncbi:2-oxoacid:acceptor oxidoreductase subunit alpha [Temperatibacter marinus]|uniref:2-oxoacid:acceptor oxidoreductase subunit alpha n=1 Tax=Temperatibacter marinus TaxID=1456591 RepID=A0AA52EIL1_9PROT|nr:2-oxoacid:acceptor oxidoreductase subunit alpha [Temperatibacter marinus]WND01870.1 2-oxoacid:acceptor oxidoreductase subunit alpha [Temperatibacter marinus]WND02969.1 2-oxoacid:acceptor oxidoreductase subunit alpha [Temperatibacter marinus]